MGLVQLPDAVQRVIERQVAEGRAADPAAFLEEAVMRLVEDAAAEQEAIHAALRAGLDDIAAGRVTSVHGPADAEALHGRLMGRLARGD